MYFNTRKLFSHLTNIPYHVTGIVTNPHAEDIEKTRVTAGLYNDVDKLLAVLKGSINVNLGTDDSEEFDVFYPELSDDIYGKVTKVKVKAYDNTR